MERRRKQREELIKREKEEAERKERMEKELEQERLQREEELRWDNAWRMAKAVEEKSSEFLEDHSQKGIFADGAWRKQQRKDDCRNRKSWRPSVLQRKQGKGRRDVEKSTNEKWKKWSGKRQRKRLTEEVKIFILCSLWFHPSEPWCFFVPCTQQCTQVSEFHIEMSTQRVLEIAMRSILSEKKILTQTREWSLPSNSQTAMQWTWQLRHTCLFYFCSNGGTKTERGRRKKTPGRVDAGADGWSRETRIWATKTRGGWAKSSRGGGRKVMHAWLQQWKRSRRRPGLESRIFCFKCHTEDASRALVSNGRSGIAHTIFDGWNEWCTLPRDQKHDVWINPSLCPVEFMQQIQREILPSCQSQKDVLWFFPFGLLLLL